MNWTTDCTKHLERAAEARRRIAVAAAQAESATKPTDADAALILDGLRALLWLDGGFRRPASTALINALIAEHGVAVVLHAAIEACASRPIGPAAWMRQVCKQRTTTDSQLKTEPKK